MDFSVAGGCGHWVWRNCADDDDRRRQFGFFGAAVGGDHCRRRYGRRRSGPDTARNFSARLQDAGVGIPAAAR